MKLSISLFTLIIAAASCTPLIERQTQVQCHQGVQIFGVPYTGAADLGIMTSTANDVIAAISDSAVQVIQYDSGNPNRSIAIASGVKATKHAIHSYRLHCPDLPMVLMGWSQGGIVVMNLLCDGIKDSHHPNIIASIAYGEETYVPNQPWSRGGCPQAGGMSKPRQDPDACLPWKGSILDYCDNGDNYCCAGPATVGHFDYANQYDQNVVKFVVRRYNKLGKPSD